MKNTISDMNWLFDGFRKSMKGSSWKEEPQRFEIDFLSELTKLSKELDGRTYKPSARSEFILNERGKTRYIHGSRIRDRIVGHSLCDNVLKEALEPYLIYNNGASQEGKGISFSREMFERDLHNYWLKRRTNNGYICFVDLSKFYDNIPHEKVKELVHPHLDEFSTWLFDTLIDDFAVDVSYMSDEEYARCMDDCFNSIEHHKHHSKEELTGEKLMPKSVNIGDQVSQNIGIFFPTRIDNYVKIVCGCKYYGRYMDDMYFICETKEEIYKILDGIKEQAKELGLFINDKKTRVVRLSDNYVYLQTKYTLSETGKVIKKIKSTTVTRERRKLKAYKSLLDKGKMPYKDIEQAYKSWMGNYAKLMSKQQLKNIKQLYIDLFGRDVRWKKKILSHSPLQTARKSKEQSTETTTLPRETSQNQISLISTSSEQNLTELPWATT